MKRQLEQLLARALESLGGTLAEAATIGAVTVERSRDARHGDFSSNIALRLAKAARSNPRALAERIIAALHRFLEAWLPLLQALPSARRVRWALDVDPMELF